MADYNRINISVYSEDEARLDRLAEQMEQRTGRRPSRSEVIRLVAEAAERDNLLGPDTWLSGFLAGRAPRRRKVAA